MSVSRGNSKTVKSEKSNDIMRKMYGNSETADVNFIFASNGHQVRIPAHKSVLAQGSTVFYTMFFGELREIGDVSIEDVVAEAFNEFLQFFYLNEITLTKEYIAEVLYLSNKYDLQVGSLKCEQFLEEILDARTMCWGYQLAILYDLQNLCLFCDQKIAFETKSILKSESFVKCSRDVLQKILSMNHLNCTEIDIFDSCMKWAEFQYSKENYSKDLSSKTFGVNEPTSIENQKLILGDLFELIRFPTMSAEQFSACLENRDGMLSSDEIADIKSHITQGCPLVVASRFNQNKRLWKLPKWSDNVLYCRRFEYGSDPDSDNDTDDDEYTDLYKEGSLSFSSNKQIILRGMATERIKPYRCRSFTCLLQAKFEIWTKPHVGLYEPYQFLFGHLEKLRTDCRNYIKFSEPIVISPCYYYEIRITFIDDTTDMYINSNIEAEKSTVQLEHGIEIKFNEDDCVCKDEVKIEYELFDNTGRLISELVFQFIANS